MKIIISGSRDITNKQKVIDILFKHVKLTDPICILHGAYPTGVDKIIANFCRSWEVNVDPHPPDWDQYGKSAGPRRNRVMAKKGDILVAIMPKEKETKGTMNMIHEAIKEDLEVHIYRI